MVDDAAMKYTGHSFPMFFFVPRCMHALFHKMVDDALVQYYLLYTYIYLSYMIPWKSKLERERDREPSSLKKETHL